MTTEETIIQIIGITFNTETKNKSIADCIPERIEGWDSLSFLNLVTLFEEEFNISFDMEDISAMSVGGEEMLRIIIKLTGM